MKRLLFSIIFLFALLGLVSMPSAAVAGEVSLGRIPSGWMEQEPVDESIHRYFLYQEKGTVLAEMIWLEEDIPSRFPLSDYLQALKENSMPGFAEYSPLEDEATMLHGWNAFIHRFHFSNQRDTLKGEMYVFVLDETGYVFLFDTTDEWFEALQPKFLSFVKGVLKFPPALEATPEDEDEEDEEEQEALSFLDDEEDDEDDGLPAIDDDEDEDDGLPAFDEDDEDDGLPEFVDDEEEGVFTIGGTSIFIELPDGAEEMDRDDDEIRVAGPDGSEIYIVLMEGPEAVAEMMKERTAGAREQGTSTLKCGDGDLKVTLFSQKSGDGVDAVLSVAWEGTGVALGVRVPKESYKDAAGWIKDMLCSVKVLDR
ncbi:MAG: hypothetical protein GX181_07185 [Synergistaceae bacterium]|nr:hypothetical protein [Synergistaceae bacterium]